jgi:hypothetical protein
MSQEVVQWLREIQELKQQLAAAEAAQTTADASADNWRRLYETEAQQRRTEAAIAKQTIEALRTELEMIKGVSLSSPEASAAQSQIQAAIAHLTTPAQLQAKLVEVWADRDRVAQTLKIEQANHSQTRKNLTTALGDTMEILKTKLRQTEEEAGEAMPEAQDEVEQEEV